MDLMKGKQTPLDKKVTNAEVKFTNFIVQHNLSLATSDHLTSLIKDVFTDSEIAKKYSSRRTKTGAIINEAFTPHCLSYLVEHCKSHPYSIGTDGSNDTGIEKMNPVCVNIFDVNRDTKVVTSHFLNMCLTSGERGGTAECIFNAIDDVFEKHEIPWDNLVALSVDNTNAMIGVRNSVASRCKQKNENCFIGGCACHLSHIAASNDHDAFSECLDLNVENVLIDLYYWFDKSSKRKGKLKEYFEFCDQDYLSVLKHISVRWLSLERCVTRAACKHASLKSYFLSEHFADERFIRLNEKYSNPLLEVAMMFLTSAIPCFTHLNLLLQREEPTIHILKSAMESLGKKLATRILTPVAVKDISSIADLDLEDPDKFKHEESIYLGIVTK